MKFSMADCEIISITSFGRNYPILGKCWKIMIRLFHFSTNPRYYLKKRKKFSIVVIFKNACTNFHKLSIFSTIRILYKILYILCNKRFDLIFKKKKKMGRHLIKFQNLRGKRSSGGAVRNDPRRGCESTALDCLSLSPSLPPEIQYSAIRYLSIRSSVTGFLSYLRNEV